MSHEPFFHDSSGSVRFWVLVEGVHVGASIGRETLHYHYRPTAQGDDPLETFLSNTDAIEDAVRRRSAAGAREPVMLRENDLGKTSHQ